MWKKPIPKGYLQFPKSLKTTKLQTWRTDLGCWGLRVGTCEGRCFKEGARGIWPALIRQLCSLFFFFWQLCILIVMALWCIWLWLYFDLTVTHIYASGAITQRHTEMSLCQNEWDLSKVCSVLHRCQAPGFDRGFWSCKMSPPGEKHMRPTLFYVLQLLGSLQLSFSFFFFFYADHF